MLLSQWNMLKVGALALTEYARVLLLDLDLYLRAVPPTNPPFDYVGEHPLLHYQVLCCRYIPYMQVLDTDRYCRVLWPVRLWVA